MHMCSYMRRSADLEYYENSEASHRTRKAKGSTASIWHPNVIGKTLRRPSRFALIITSYAAPFEMLSEAKRKAGISIHFQEIPPYPDAMATPNNPTKQILCSHIPYPPLNEIADRHFLQPPTCLRTNWEHSNRGAAMKRVKLMSAECDRGCTPCYRDCALARFMLQAGYREVDLLLRDRPPSASPHWQEWQDRLSQVQGRIGELQQDVVRRSPTKILNQAIQPERRSLLLH